MTELASLHAAIGPEGTGFTVFGCADGAIGLGGQFEPGSVPVLRRLLPRIRDGVDDGACVIDVADVEYVDHRLLRAPTPGPTGSRCRCARLRRSRPG